MRGAPHSGFGTLISQMSWRISPGVLGRPPRGLDFQRHQARKPARCHLMMVSGLRIFSATGIVTMTLAGSPLGLAVTGFEGLILLREVLARRAAWKRYEERLGGAASAEPGAVIRLEPGERSPLPAEIVEGTGTAIGDDGLPVQIRPGSQISAGARLNGGPFVLQLRGGRPFLPEPRPAPPAGAARAPARVAPSQPGPAAATRTVSQGNASRDKAAG